MPDVVTRCDVGLFDLRLRLEADDARALAAARAQFGDRPGEGGCLHIGLRRYAVSDGNFEQVTGQHLRLRRDGFALDANGATGTGEILYPAADHPLLPEMIETAALFLAAQADRTPLHAGAVMLGDVALVLAGPSGMGKSSLALAGARAGLPVLSEDTLYIQTAPRLRLWSRTSAIHLLEESAPPDMPGLRRFRSGRWKRVLPLAAARQSADRAMLCVLARGERAALTALLPEEAVMRLTRVPEPGYDFYGDRMASAVRSLARERCWQLALSRDPAEAIAALQRHFACACA